MAFPTGWPTGAPNNSRSLRFYKTGTATANFSDSAWLFFQTDTLYNENLVYSPAENGVRLGAFVTTIGADGIVGNAVTSDAITINWTESSVAKTATLTSTSTVGGTNAANISAASINRATGALSITFAALHPPDTDSIKLTYRINRRQGYSSTIMIKAATAALEYSFDGVTVDGIVAIGETLVFRNRYEGCIAVRGNTSVYTIQIW
jgi:hypothetical protein